MTRSKFISAWKVKAFDSANTVQARRRICRACGSTWLPGSSALAAACGWSGEVGSALIATLETMIIVAIAIRQRVTNNLRLISTCSVLVCFRRYLWTARDSTEFASEPDCLTNGVELILYFGSIAENSKAVVF